MNEAPATPRLPAVAKDGMAVFVFDGRGGVRGQTEAEATQMAAPPKGFVLIAGNPRAPDFAAWLKAELGDFAADQLSTTGSRSRCTVLDDKALVAVRVARPGSEPEEVGKQLLALWIERGRVVVATELNIVELLGMVQWQQNHHAPLSPADLVARLALRASDRIEPLIERLGGKLDSIEESMLAVTGDGELRGRLAHIRRTIIGMRRLVWPQRDMLNTLEIEELSFFTARDRVRLREAAARAGRLGEELAALSERSVLVHEQMLDMRAESLNRTMLVLTAVTVVFMPLTVISGVLGMNVAGIPFSQSPYAFIGVCVGLVVLALAMVLWMRHRKWL